MNLIHVYIIIIVYFFILAINTGNATECNCLINFEKSKKKPKYLKKMSLLRLSLSETVEYLFIKWNASIGRLPQRPSNEGKHLTPANINAGAFVEQIVLSVPYKDPIRSQFLAISLLLVSRSANLRVTKHEIYNLIIQLFSFYNF